jgi:N-acetylglucosamine-6-phosphate deacetylase
MMIIADGKVLTRDGFREGISIRIEGGKIVKVGSSEDVSPADGEEVIDAKGLIVSPGFVDLHCHGGDGADVMDGEYADVCTVARYHASCGTTSLLATTCCDSLEHLKASLYAIETAMKKGTGGASVLGAHMEGPYFSKKNYGCHMPKYVRDPRPEEYEEFFKYEGVVKHMTVAPELPGAVELIKRNQEVGIVSSAGHTVARYEEMMAALEAGVTHSTHIYCAMSTVERRGPKRFPGVAEISLTDAGMTTELISDGKHVPNEMMKIAYLCKGPDGLCLVTDAMRGAGMTADDTYTFGGREGTPAKIVDDVAVTLDDSGFASSTAGMDRLVRTMVTRDVCQLEDALRMASVTPARVLSVDDRKGTIEEGKDGDITILDADVKTRFTIVAGEVVFGT